MCTSWLDINCGIILGKQWLEKLQLKSNICEIYYGLDELSVKERLYITNLFEQDLEINYESENQFGSVSNYVGKGTNNLNLNIDYNQIVTIELLPLSKGMENK